MADSPRDMLQELAARLGMLVAEEKQLHAKKQFPPTIPFDVADWFLQGVGSYLAAEQEADLDGALGLKRGRGRPKAEKPPKRTKEIFYLRMKKPRPSWIKLAETYNASPRDLQRELKLHFTALASEHLCELLAKDDIN